MAGLGAGAGFFQGRVAGEQLRQGGEQLRQGAERNRMAADRDAWDRKHTGRNDIVAEEDRKLARELEIRKLGMMEDDRKFGRQQVLQQQSAEAEQRSYLRGRDAANDNRTDRLDSRNERADAWTEALNEQTMRIQEAQFGQMQQTIEQFRMSAAQEREQLANRDRIAKSGIAGALQATIENGGFLPTTAIPILKKMLPGTNPVGGYMANGKFVVEFQDGQGKVNPEVFSPDAIAMTLGALYGDKAPGLLGGVTRGQGYAEPFAKERERSLEKRLESLTPGTREYELAEDELQRIHGLPPVDREAKFAAADEERSRLKKNKDGTAVGRLFGLTTVDADGRDVKKPPLATRQSDLGSSTKQGTTLFQPVNLGGPVFRAPK
jgi:hypothetical protein